jgi:signal transduction histidine kinase
MTSFANTSIRLKTLFLLALVLSGSVGSVTVKGWIKFIDEQRSLNLSYDLELVLKNLSEKRYDETLYSELKIQRATLAPPHRADAMSDVIQAYAEKSPALLKRRVDHFLKNENEFRSYTRNMMAHTEKEIAYFAILASGSLLLLFFLSIYYVQHSVFKPMRGLSRKMTDFLNNKYSYQFSVPAQNEVGHLQAKFNALAQQVLANMDELKTLDRAKTEFLSIASHELRTPLTSIKGSLCLLQTGVTGPVNESTKNLINIAETETDRLIRLINDILDLAKIEAGRLPLEKSWHGVLPLFQETLNSLGGLATAAGVELALNSISPNIDLEMDCDRIQQVLTNLISNAIKFSPRGSRVDLKAELEPHGIVRITVSDQGKGIAPDDLERIFEKFSQATSPDNPLVKGTGLGLAIARAIVEEHGGEIGVQSVVGKGSQFYFTIPNWKKSHYAFEPHPSFTTGVAA